MAVKGNESYEADREHDSTCSKGACHRRVYDTNNALNLTVKARLEELLKN